MKYISENTNKKRRKSKRLKLIGLYACLALIILSGVFFTVKTFKNGITLPTFNFFSKGEDKDAYPVMVLGQNVEVAAEKIVSLSPMATQALIALPVQSKIVGVSEYCDKGGLDIPTVGTPLIPKIEEIINLSPQYVIVQTPLNEVDKIKLEQSGIKILQVTLPESLEQLQEFYKNLSYLFFGKTLGEEVSNNLFADITTKMELYNYGIEQSSKKNVLILINKYGMAVTLNTIESEMAAPFFNVTLKSDNNYVVSKEELVASKFDLIIAGDELTKEDIGLMGLDSSNAYIEDKIYFIPQKELENFSPKLLMRFSAIATEVYKENIKLATDILNKEE